MDIAETVLSQQTILDSLNDGVYVVDRERQIVFWGKSAERITGWPGDEIIGMRCSDGVLCHEDKDGHQLCGEEYCPLHRCMVTGTSSTTPIILFARSKDGGRVPMRVSVAPIRDESGEVIGGVETFRDLSEEMADFLRAKRIQSLSLETDLPADSRVSFLAHYNPHDIIGGDYYSITQLDANRYGFLLADVCGRGVSAALYTMYLNYLWRDNSHLLTDPAQFTEAMNAGFAGIVKEEEPFAAAIVGLIDLEAGQLRLVGAGNPPPILVHPDGEYEPLKCSGLPLGCFQGVSYEETTVVVQPKDHLLMFTDGAIEINSEMGTQLGVDGLINILRNLGYPGSDANFDAVEEAMLKHSGQIRLEDDLTFLEMSFS